jgi:hypothetical protein
MICEAAMLPGSTLPLPLLLPSPSPLLLPWPALPLDVFEPQAEIASAQATVTIQRTAPVDKIERTTACDEAISLPRRRGLNPWTGLSAIAEGILPIR